MGFQYILKIAQKILIRDNNLVSDSEWNVNYYFNFFSVLAILIVAARYFFANLDLLILLFSCIFHNQPKALDWHHPKSYRSHHNSSLLSSYPHIHWYKLKYLKWYFLRTPAAFGCIREPESIVFVRKQ